MNDDNNRLRSLDCLDSLIDRALDSYTPRGLRPGLTERVLCLARTLSGRKASGLSQRG